MIIQTAKKEIHYRCKKCLPAIALAKEGGDHVWLIGNEADREIVKKEREK